MDFRLSPRDDTPPERSMLEACNDGDLSKIVRLLSVQDDVPPGCGKLLEAAAGERHPDIVRYLLMKYDKQQLPVDAYHALCATYGGALECLRLLYEREPTLLHNNVEHFGDPLQQAISRSDIDLVNFNLQQGADPGRVISDETSLFACQFVPIETAVLRSTPEMVRILLRHGATLKDTTALDLAAAIKRPNSFEMVVCLVDEGADINATSRDQEYEHGRTPWGPPLQSAIQAQHVPVVQYLLAKGANPQVQDSKGRTAWDKASAVGNEDIIRLLATIPRIGQRV
ncbi:MAG: hypothetical protein Q9180_005680 [Flavoplaca navasiana]